MRSGNPALSESTFLDLASGSVVTSPDQVMTLNGTANKTGILLLLTVLTAAFALEPGGRRVRPDFRQRKPVRHRWRDRRPGAGIDHHLQEGMVAGHRADVRAG